MTVNETYRPTLMDCIQEIRGVAEGGHEERMG
jgi:hypothetical protein